MNYMDLDQMLLSGIFRVGKYHLEYSYQRKILFLNFLTEFKNNNWLDLLMEVINNYIQEIWTLEKRNDWKKLFR